MNVHCILPSSPWLADSKTNIPLGILYVAAALREAGHTVTVTSLLSRTLHAPLVFSDEAMAADVHLVSICTPQFNEALEIAAYIKDRNPKAILIAGGPHVSYEPREVKWAGRQETYHMRGPLRQRRSYEAMDGRWLYDAVGVGEGENIIRVKELPVLLPVFQTRLPLPTHPGMLARSCESRELARHAPKTSY